MLALLGSDSPRLAEEAAAVFARLHRRRGTRIVLISGGVGRSTPGLMARLRGHGRPPAWPEVRNGRLLRPLASALEAQEGRAAGTVDGRAAVAPGAPKPLWEGPVSFDTPAERVRAAATEADVFLEVFLSALAERLPRLRVDDPNSVSLVRWRPGGRGGAHNSPLIDTRPHPGRSGHALNLDRLTIVVEDGSTHTGANCAYSRELLSWAGFDVERLGRATVLMQQPMLLRRSEATFRREFGEGCWPVGAWTTPEAEEFADASVLEQAKLIVLAAGEYARFLAYKDRHLTMPNDFPHDVAEAYAGLEAEVDVLRKATRRFMETFKTSEEILLTLPSSRSK
jgi:hypothetical protein